MYELIERAKGTTQASSAYSSLYEGVEALARRAGVVLHQPGARILAQQPQRVVVVGRDGGLTTLVLRRIPTG